MKYHMNLNKLPNNLILEYEFKARNMINDFYFIEKFYLNNLLIESKYLFLKVFMVKIL